jgi:hypothetical protein
MLVGSRPSGDLAGNDGHGWLARHNGSNAHVVAQHSDTDSLRRREEERQIFGAGETTKGRSRQ